MNYSQYSKLNYQSYLNKKNHIIPLDNETNYHRLYYDSIQRKLIYSKGNDELSICDITNLKIMWDITEAKESEKLNEFCFFIFQKKVKGGFLFCGADIESKEMILQLIFTNSMNCEIKISLHRQEEIVPEQGKASNHNIYFSQHVVYTQEGYFYEKRNKDELSEISEKKFQDAKISLTDNSINIEILTPNDEVKNFLANQVKPRKTFQQKIINLNNILCGDLIADLLFLKEESVQMLLVSETTASISSFNSYCWTLTPCRCKRQFLLCFNNEKQYLKFRRMFIISAILYHFIRRWEKIWDESNKKKYLSQKVNQFISQNVQRYPGQKVKSNKELKNNPDYDNIYRNYKYVFKKPISNELLFLKQVEKTITAKKADKKCLENRLKTSLNKNNILDEKAASIINKFRNKNFDFVQEKIKKMAGLLD